MFLADITTTALGDVAIVIGFLGSFGGIAVVWGAMRNRIKNLEDQQKLWETRCGAHHKEFTDIQASANTEFREAVKAILTISTEIKVSIATNIGATHTLGAQLDALNKRMDVLDRRMDDMSRRIDIASTDATNATAAAAAAAAVNQQRGDRDQGQRQPKRGS